ncbi:MAG: class I SAM-dependent methyltransferase [Phycisphaerae bacterium]|nr:class I SAM-dependent methyltransferase [Phycisphaerae bacterium]
MRLSDTIRRSPAPAAWTEGDNIPWHEPGFSARMLAEHLSQDHDAASRRSAKIDAHVDYIHGDVLDRRPTRILDLCCGPGLYSRRLAALGHTCHGIDYSPASIAYATKHGQPFQGRCSFVEANIREVDYGVGYGLAMVIYGEFNVFPRRDIAAVLRKVHSALSDDGILLIEPHTFDAIHAIAEPNQSWSSAESGLFSDKPHLCLEEGHWDPASRTTTRRFYVIDAATGEVTRWAASYQAYTDEQYCELLRASGFEDIAFLPSLMGKPDADQPGLIAVCARSKTAR